MNAPIPHRGRLDGAQTDDPSAPLRSRTEERRPPIVNTVERRFCRNLQAQRGIDF